MKKFFFSCRSFFLILLFSSMCVAVCLCPLALAPRARDAICKLWKINGCARTERGLVLENSGGVVGRLSFIS